MDTGLRPQDLKEIIEILKAGSAVDEAILFGSRAKGNYKQGSDVDIAIKGTEIDHQLVAMLNFQLNEDSAMPYFFDIVHYEGIMETALKEHIDRVGLCIYARHDQENR